MELTRRVGVSRSYLSAGRNEVGAQVLIAISREFEKSIAWLLTGGPQAIAAGRRRNLRPIRRELGEDGELGFEGAAILEARGLPTW